MENQNSLENRIEKIERSARSPILVSIQYFVSPVLLIIIGFYFNNKLESTKQEFQKLELEVRQIEAAQTMLQELFSGTPERAFIAESLMSCVVSKELSVKINQIVTDYYRARLDGTKDKIDTKALTEIRKAASSVNSVTAKNVVSEIDSSVAYVVVGSFRETSNLQEEVRRLEVLEYHTETYLSESGSCTLTLGKMTLAAATDKLNEALGKGDIGSDAYLATGRTFVSKLPP